MRTIEQIAKLYASGYISLAGARSLARQYASQYYSALQPAILRELKADG